MANVADLIRSAAGSQPTRTALVCGDRTLTWAALDALVDALAAGLASRGFAPGDRVALLQGNTPEFVVSYFGILRAGLVAVPLNTAYTAPEVAHVLSDSGAVLLLAEERTERVARAAAPDGLGPEVLVAASADWDTLLRAGRGGPPDRAGDGLAVLLFTAGTSGRPKGAMLRHDALLADVALLRGLDHPPAVLPEDVALVVLPLFHVYGLNAVLSLAASAAATCVLLDRFDPAETLAIVRRHRVTTIAGAPPMYVAWSQQPDVREALAGVRLLTSGGAPLPAAVHARFLAVAGQAIWEGYGMTETAPVVATTLVSGAPKAGCVGRPLPGLEVRLVEDGAEVDDGDPGEVWVRGATLFDGYWPDAVAGPDADGWFRTGDVAYLDADGDLRLVDRRREVILVSGFNVYPREIEIVIDALPEVAECAVVSVPHAFTGEAVKAFVVPVAGARLSSERVLAHCEERLARFKCPTVVQIVAELPHSATGKVAKGRLREVHGT